LVLSEFSGTAAVLPSAYIVNPHDDEAVSAGLEASLNAPSAERTDRMRRMREYVMHYDNYTWARSFLSTIRTIPARPAERNPSPPWIPQSRQRSRRRRQWWNIHIGGY
jgi:trehalose-6-phosphate synthase